MDPTCGRFGVCEDLSSQSRIKPLSNLGDDLSRHPIRAEWLERLHDQRAFPVLEAGLFQGGVLEDERRLADLVRPFRSIGTVDDMSRDLRGQADDVLRRRAARLDAPAELAGDRLSHLIYVRAQIVAQQRAESRMLCFPANSCT